MLFFLLSLSVCMREEECEEKQREREREKGERCEKRDKTLAQCDRHQLLMH